MPLTVITVKNVPISLRGDLSKWIQEIATGVFVGNFNVRIRELLWQRVQEAAGIGEATLTYPARNEIGYAFQISGSVREVIDCDGIPLVMMPAPERAGKSDALKPGFSRASKIRRAKTLYGGQRAARNAEALCGDRFGNGWPRRGEEPDHRDRRRESRRPNRDDL